MSTWTVTAMGVDLTSRLVSLSEIVETKDVLLAKSTLFAGQAAAVLDDADGALSGPLGLFKARDWANGDFSITRDGVALFQGFIRAVPLGGSKKRTADVVAENVLARATDAYVSVKATRANPAAVALAILEAAGLAAYIDYPSFKAAALASRRVAATISVDTGTAQATATDMLASISDLCSITFIATGTQIRAQAFAPYQGSGANCKRALTDDTVDKFGELEWDQEAFYNEIILRWGDDKTATARAASSAAADRGWRTAKINATDSSKVVVADAGSAAYFARTYLARAAYQRMVLTAEAGSDFTDARTGDRHLVTSAPLGLTAKAFEIIEVSRKLSTDSVGLRLVSLPDPA